MPLYIHGNNPIGSSIPELSRTALHKKPDRFSEKFEKESDILNCRKHLLRTISHHSITGFSGFLYRMSQVVSWIFRFGRTEWSTTSHQMTRIIQARYENQLTKKLIVAVVKEYGLTSKERLDHPDLPLKLILSPSGRPLKVNFNRPHELENYNLLEKRCRLAVRRSLSCFSIEKASSRFMEDLLQFNRFAKRFCTKETPSAKEKRENEKLRNAFKSYHWKSAYLKESILQNKKPTESFLEHLFETHRHAFHLNLEKHLGFSKEAEMPRRLKVTLNLV